MRTVEDVAPARPSGSKPISKTAVVRTGNLSRSFARKSGNMVNILDTV